MSPAKLLYKLLRYSGLPWLVRETLQRDKVTIAMFHDPSPEAAEQAFSWLAKHYNIISLEAFMEARRKGSGKSLPKKAMIITLDDGHIRNYEFMPAVKKLGIPVTIFLCAGLIGTNRHYWFLFKQEQGEKEQLKTLPNALRLERLEQMGFRPDREFSHPQALSREQLEEMKSAIDFQSHTVFHPCLPTCTTREAWEEISRSKQILEEEHGLEVRALAFPNGDYSERDIEMIKRAGYECALTVDFGFNTLKTDAYKLRRMSIDDTGNIDAVSVKASGVWTFFMTLIGKQRKSGWAEIKEENNTRHVHYHLHEQ